MPRRLSSLFHHRFGVLLTLLASWFTANVPLLGAAICRTKPGGRAPASSLKFGDQPAAVSASAIIRALLSQTWVCTFQR